MWTFLSSEYPVSCPKLEALLECRALVTLDGSSEPRYSTFLLLGMVNIPRRLDSSSRYSLDSNIMVELSTVNGKATPQSVLVRVEAPKTIIMTQPLPRQFNIQSFADPGAFAGERRILTSEGVQLQEPSASGGPHDHGLGIPIDLIPGPHAIGIVWRAIEEIGTRDRYQLLAQGLRLPPASPDRTRVKRGLSSSKSLKAVQRVFILA
ncbi:unnamed protein product [Somion occarium]|uniref:Uncharacterized protein n=1 Tax=Somion occarium TaxID=3059160 RepID=A0ABP1CHY6_9APHY